MSSNASIPGVSKTCAALCALALATLAGPAAAADIAGVWHSTIRDSQIEIAPCGDAVCGKLLSASPAKSNPQLLDVHNKDPDLRGRSMIGTRLFEGFKGGPRKWSGGKLYNPDDGNTYGGSLTLVDDDHLMMKGCTLFGLICKGHTMTRVR